MTRTAPSRRGRILMGPRGDASVDGRPRAMTVAQRHMFYLVLGQTAGLSTVLCLIILLLGTQSLFYLLAEGAITLRLFLQAVVLLAPDPVYRGVPFAITIAIVNAYLKWGRNNEIVS